MNRVVHSARVTAVASARDRYDLGDPAYQAYQILHAGFTVAPIIAGADKFFHLLVNWDNYLAPVVSRVLGGHGHAFMLVAGVIEIVAGIGVALRPRVFAYVVAAWLLGIILNLLLFPPLHPFPHYDVALSRLRALPRSGGPWAAQRPLRASRLVDSTPGGFGGFRRAGQIVAPRLTGTPAGRRERSRGSCRHTSTFILR